MKRAFAVAILLLTACGSASDEKPHEEMGTAARGVPAEGGLQERAPAGRVWVWSGSETAPHDLDADGAACGEEAGSDLISWARCMQEKGWRLERR